MTRLRRWRDGAPDWDPYYFDCTILPWIAGVEPSSNAYGSTGG